MDKTFHFNMEIAVRDFQNFQNMLSYDVSQIIANTVFVSRYTVPVYLCFKLVGYVKSVFKRCSFF